MKAWITLDDSQVSKALAKSTWLLSGLIKTICSRPYAAYLIFPNVNKEPPPRFWHNFSSRLEISCSNFQDIAFRCTFIRRIFCLRDMRNINRVQRNLTLSKSAATSGKQKYNKYETENIWETKGNLFFHKCFLVSYLFEKMHKCTTNMKEILLLRICCAFVHFFKQIRNRENIYERKGFPFVFQMFSVSYLLYFCFPDVSLILTVN